MGYVYLVTGATSYLGNNLVSMLADRKEKVRALVLPGDPLERVLPANVDVFYGDVTDTSSLEAFFKTEKDDLAIVIHCAGIVTLNEEFNQKVIDVNVGGTKNVLELCHAKHVRKLVYISSTSAIPLLPKGKVMKEVNHFDPSVVRGCYARSKAEATQLILDAVKQGLDASIIHPTGIFGVGCYGKSSLIDTLVDIYTGKMAVLVNGAADFIDVRDLSEAIINCCHKGRRGECYIVGGHYISIKELFAYVKRVSGRGYYKMSIPIWLCKAIAPVSERISRMSGKVPALTSFSIFQLTCNMAYSTEKAKKELDLRVRPFEDSVRDTIAFLKKEGRI